MLTSQAFLLSRELAQVERYIKTLVEAFELLLSESRLPNELYKLAEDLSKRASDVIRIERGDGSELNKIDFRALMKKNINLADKLQKKLVNCMDDLCEEYAKICRSQCNVQ